MVLETWEEVYEPAEDSILLADSVEASGKTLDMGTGCGIQAISASKTAKEVLGVDVNPRSVELAKKNASKNDAVNAHFIVSDLFEEVEGVFDTIIFNPPYLPVKEEGSLERAWSGGEKGMQIIERFIEDIRGYTAVDGRVYLLVSSLNKPENILESFRSLCYKAEVVSEKKMFFEELKVVKAVLKSKT